MAFSPFARFRNFTVENLKLLLEVYPDIAHSMTWSQASDIIELSTHGYKKTAYQQACQFGLEDRGSGNFRIQSYLYTFEDSNLERYVEFWSKTYYAPNPYIKSDDAPFLIYCEFVKEILLTDKHEIDFYDFFSRRIGGKSDDILINILKDYCLPLKYRKREDKEFFYIDDEDLDSAKHEVEMIEREFPIVNEKDRGSFFERFTFANFCRFYGMSNELNEKDLFVKNNFNTKRQTGGENVILYGVPGAGKSFRIKEQYCSDDRYIERVVFHPEYTYSDFTGQILPRVEDDKLKYVFSPGPFTKIMKKAWDDPGQKYYLIIEEINRGNASSIFGEIFQLLDRKDEDKYSADEVGESEYGITNYDIASYVYGDDEHQVRLPSNLYLIATMNTSDQNVFTLDTAFQRRWDMRQIENRFDNISHSSDYIVETHLNWGAFATTINDLVIQSSNNMISSEDKRLGAYFVKKNELGIHKFPEKVLKYLWDDAFKMDRNSIFKDECNSLEDVITRYENAEGDRLEAVLKVEVYEKMLSKMKTG